MTYGSRRRCRHCGRQMFEDNRGRTICPRCSSMLFRTAALERGCPEEHIEAWEQACINGNCDICGKPASQEKRSRRLEADYASTEPPFPRGCLCHKCNVKLRILEDEMNFRPVFGDSKFRNYLLERDYRYEYLKG